jgi:hypothetical protein
MRADRAGKKDRDEGSIAIDALIGVLIFMIFMFSMFSYIVLFMANNLIEHALMEATESMALETYELSNTNDDYELSDLNTLIESINLEPESKYNGFSDDDHWYVRILYEESDDSHARVSAAAKKRFAAYLGGGEDHADHMLESMGITDGLDGVSIEGAIKDGDLTVTAKYKIHLLMGFTLGGKPVANYPVEQSSTAKLWGKDS